MRTAFTALALLLPVLTGCSKSEGSAAPAAMLLPPQPAIADPRSAAIDSATIPDAPQLAADGYVLMDAGSGRILGSRQLDTRLEPASLTKIMSAYVVFAALRAGEIALTDLVKIGTHARAQRGSRMFVELGSEVSVEDLVRGMIVQSGNDAAVALAGFVGGSESAFVERMNAHAQQLGMMNTRFRNPTGLPDRGHYTSARDLAMLARAMVREFPEYYRWYGEREFTWNGITQQNRNGLLRRDPSVDGMKTGYTSSAGYCLVTSAERDGLRLITVVLGAPSSRSRERMSAVLLDYGFSVYESREIAPAGRNLATMRVWKGAVDEVALTTDEPLTVTVPRGQAQAIVANVELPWRLYAPLDRDRPIGRLRLTLGDDELLSRDVYPVESVAPAGFFGRLIDDVRMRMESSDVAP